MRGVETWLSVMRGVETWLSVMPGMETWLSVMPGMETQPTGDAGCGNLAYDVARFGKSVYDGLNRDKNHIDHFAAGDIINS